MAIPAATVSEISVTVTGDVEAQVALRHIDSRIEKVLKAEVIRAGKFIQKDARSAAPPPATVPRVTPKKQRRTARGDLKRNIIAVETRDPLTRLVIARAPHSPFVEFGTGQRGAAGAHPPLPEGYAHGSKPGMQAQPYMHPAQVKAEEWFPVNIEQAIERAISEGT